MSKHSPGPWRWEDGRIVDVNGHEPIFVDSSCAWEAGDETIGYCVPADAVLIAAAPEMLELLAEAMNWLEDASSYAQTPARRFDERVRALLKRIDGDS